MVGLYRGIDPKLGKTFEILRVNMLGMLNAEPAVPFRILFDNLREHVKDETVRTVTDGVDGKLQPRLVGPDRPLLESSILYDVHRKPPRSGIGRKWFEEKSGGRTK